MCKKVRESLSSTASYSDTECPPDSDACYVQSRQSWGTAGTTKGRGWGEPGEVGSIKPAVRFTEILKEHSRQQLHGPRCTATSILQQWRGSHVDLTLCDLASKWPPGKQNEQKGIGHDCCWWGVGGCVHLWVLLQYLGVWVAFTLQRTHLKKKKIFIQSYWLHCFSSICSTHIQGCCCWTVPPAALPGGSW